MLKGESEQHTLAWVHNVVSALRLAGGLGQSLLEVHHIMVEFCIFAMFCCGRGAGEWLVMTQRYNGIVLGWRGGNSDVENKRKMASGTVAHMH